ncbi:putative bzip transcription factor protein [Phialemonium atrogriseum]|uniref:Bzip transcription factor protein n=1 Tax=Phialemonium atrogriseum TaxID=1093897 RepID=A0AAJ0C9T9_9PEZI|nr:putative bzip transcription factor protein [Phialemonium atrogriseum]KAK1772793.1 putative bzip transcription factor protein [Phialemonium atrogriseum]
MSTSPAATSGVSQSGIVDHLVDSLIDFSEYDNNPYQSPSLSPTTTSKMSFSKPIKAEPTTTSLLPASQPMSGPSHQYDQYKQQTGIVPGALASTHAVNQNSQVQGYSNFNVDFLALADTEDIFDFNAAPSQSSLNTDVDMDFDSSSADPSYFFGDATVNPSSIGGHEPSAIQSPTVLSAQTGNVGRLWPGMHQQAALAKAQAQQRQQQQHMIQQQRRNAQNQQPKQPQRPKNQQPTDPIVEQKITQLLNSMRAKPASPDSAESVQHLNISRPKKDEDDMDEDERLLASEEGKKLSSKERRQLRNKVSARAFRSRRKEYITQLEAEISLKVSENTDLRSHNRALVDENKRLSDLTRMLLSSPSFSDFLDRLSSNPQQVPQAQPTPQQQENRPLPKDVNTYAAQQQLQQQQHQHIGMAMIPEQPLDFSMLSLDTADAFNFQPQVYAVLDTPEPAMIETSILSGKSSNFVGTQLESDEEKVEMPVIKKAPVLEKEPVAEGEKESPTATVVDEEFESDPAFALYHDSTPVSATVAKEPVEIDTDAFSHVDVFGGIEPDKALARYELVDASEEEVAATCAMARVQRISAGLESVMTRLELMTVDL